MGRIRRQEERLHAVGVALPGRCQVRVNVDFTFVPEVHVHIELFQVEDQAREIFETCYRKALALVPNLYFETKQPLAMSRPRSSIGKFVKKLIVPPGRHSSFDTSSEAIRERGWAPTEGPMGGHPGWYGLDAQRPPGSPVIYEHDGPRGREPGNLSFGAPNDPRGIRKGPPWKR